MRLSTDIIVNMTKCIIFLWTEIVKYHVFVTKSCLVSYPDATSFDDVSPQGVSDDSSTGSRIHGKMYVLKERGTAALIMKY